MHVERGDMATVSGLKMGTHTGTHIDGPIHFLAGSPGTDAVPLENLNEVLGWHLDDEAGAYIDEVLAESIKDPVGPEFMAPPEHAPDAAA